MVIIYVFIAVMMLGVLAVVGAVMGKKDCPHCREKIDAKATVCPHCQKDVEYNEYDAARRQNRMGIVAAVVLIGGVALLSYVAISSNGTKTKARALPTDVKTESTLSGVPFSEIKKSVEDLSGVGLIKRIDDTADEVFVDFGIWMTLSYDKKQFAAKVFAEYFARLDDDKHPDAVIRDNMTGKRLMKYSSVFGFSDE